MPARISIGPKAVANLRYALRVAVAAVSAFLVSTLLGLSQPSWSVISAVVVVMQSNLGGTMLAAQERLLGTVVGAAIGGVGAHFNSHSPLGTSLMLASTIGPLAFLAAGRPSLRLAPITAAIVMGATADASGSARVAIERVVEIALGCVVGVAAMSFVFPARWKGDLTTTARAALAAVAVGLRKIPALSEGGLATEEFVSAQADVRSRMAAFDKVVGDATRAPGGRAFAERGASLSRALWRVRNDAIAVGRAYEATAALALESLASLREAAEGVLADQARRLDALAAPPSESDSLRAETAAARTRLDAALAGLRAHPEGGPHDLAAVAPILGMVFALHSLSRNVDALARRLRDLESVS